MKRSKLSRRITWRVLGIILCFNILIIGAILLFVLEVSLMNSSMRGKYVTDGIAGNLENMMYVAKTGTFNNRLEVEYNMETPEQVFNSLEKILTVNTHLKGCFAAFEPDYFKGQGRWFEAYAYRTDSTHIEIKQIGSPHHDYFNGVWYKRGLSLARHDNGYLTDLYYDDCVNSSMYCSYVVPLFDRKGNKVGVYGIDIELQWLDELMHETVNEVKQEFFIDKDDSIETSDDDIYFSIQIQDSQGNRIAGSDSLDTNILKNKQEIISKELGMYDLLGTPYYISTSKIGQTDWTLTVFQHREMVFFWGVVLATVILFFMSIGGIVIFFFMSRSIRHATKPLAFLSKSAQEVAKGNFNTTLPTFRHNDEVAQLRDSFDTMQQSLRQYIEELKETTASKAAMMSELNVAHSIQMSMLPKTFPAFPNRRDIDLYASLTPAKAVGGDLYDFFIHDEKLFFCIGDVSGKGVPASLVMAVSRTLFRNISAHTDRPSHIVDSMNVNICDGNDNCMFVTLFVGVLELKTRLLRYCNAGHDAPFIQDALLPCDSNLPIGVTTDMTYTEQETTIPRGATLFLYTDGLTEAENASQEHFGMKRITDVITAFSGSPQELIETMIAAVHQYVGETEQSDDLTMLAFKLN